MALLGSLRLRPALQEVNWTIVVLIACMIPLGAAVQETGAARVIANGLMAMLPWTAPFAVTALMLLIAAALTVFVDHVSTAASLSPRRSEEHTSEPPSLMRNPYSVFT